MKVINYINHILYQLSYIKKLAVFKCFLKDFAGQWITTDDYCNDNYKSCDCNLSHLSTVE